MGDDLDVEKEILFGFPNDRMGAVNRDEFNGHDRLVGAQARRITSRFRLIDRVDPITQARVFVVPNQLKAVNVNTDNLFR
jgi:hypothetical protein